MNALKRKKVDQDAKAQEWEAEGRAGRHIK